MADEDAPNPRPFDVRTIRYLVRLMSENDLSEIDLRDGELRIRLLRGPRVTVTGMAAPAAVPAPLPQPTVVQAPAVPPAPPPAKADSSLLEIKSSAIGTFYAKPNPDAEPYVRVGSRVTPTSVIGQLEAMKLFTEILAECSGIIREILVENQQSVEYGQVLFRVDPKG